MRMRKKKWADPWLEQHSDYIYEDPKEYAGKWRELLGCEILHVEIGTGKGDYLNTMAAMYPEEGWVGIEKDRSAAAVAARKAVEAEHPDLHNKRMIVHAAEDMMDWFVPGEIDVIHLNFSDPWPKKGHAKRRLTSTRFLEVYDKILKADGVVEFKTDNQDLFTFSLESAEEGGWEILGYTRDLHHDPMCEGNVMTEYEEKFSSQGNPICKMVICRKK